MVADPGAEHGRASLLSDQELRFQLDRLAGPRRELPDRRFHELFEQRADAPGRRRGRAPRPAGTYRGSTRANRLARRLRVARREGVVAVVTERNLDWMASSSRSSRPVARICRSSRTFRPIGSRPRWRGPSARWC